MSGIIGGAGSKSGIIGTTELVHEEGTWSGTVGSSSNVSGGPGVRYMKYLKIGKSVQLWFELHSSGSYLFDSTTAEAMWRIDGIPFLKSWTSGTDSGTVGGWVGSGTSRVCMGFIGNGGGENDKIWIYVPAANIENRNQSNLYGHFSYIAA